MDDPTTPGGVVYHGRVWLCEPTNRSAGYQRTFPKGTRDAGRPSGYPGFGMSAHLAIPFLGLALIDNTDPERLAQACAEEGRAEVPVHGHAPAPGGCGRCAGASDRDALRRGPRDSRLLENQRARSVE